MSAVERLHAAIEQLADLDNTSGELSLVLHRPVDAQLAILRAARSHLNTGGRFSVNEHMAVYLADAILGGAS